MTPRQIRGFRRLMIGTWGATAAIALLMSPFWISRGAEWLWISAILLKGLTIATFAVAGLWSLYHLIFQHDTTACLHGFLVASLVMCLGNLSAFWGVVFVVTLVVTLGSHWITGNAETADSDESDSTAPPQVK